MAEFARPVPAAVARHPPAVPLAARTPGQPLEPAVAARFGAAFDHDFSRVRVHADTRAGRSADHHDALAYTVGSHVVFGTGRYHPTSDVGLRLIGHELAHVAQHERGPGTGDYSVRHEAEADRAVDAALSGRAAAELTGAPTALAAQGRGASTDAHNPDQGVLHQIMTDLLNSLPVGTRRTVEHNKTIAIAVVNDGEGFRTLVYTVSGNWTSPQLREAMSRLNIERWNPNPRAPGRGDVGAPSDAEQLMFEAASENPWEVETLVTSRDFCPDCAEAVRAEIAPRGRGGSRGGGRNGPEVRYESLGAPEVAPFEGTPGLSSAKGAMEGAALMINQAMARIANQAQIEAAQEALQGLQTKISQLRREGKWVIATAVMSEPRSVDVGSNIATTADQLMSFLHIQLRWGISRAEAQHPPDRFEAAPPSAIVQRYEALPDSRRMHGYDIAVYAPIATRTTDDERVTALVGQIRNAEVARRYLDILAAVRDPHGNHTAIHLQGLLAPFDARNTSVLDDMAIMTAMLRISGPDLATLVAAFPGMLRSRAQIHADRAASTGR